MCSACRAGRASQFPRDGVISRWGSACSYSIPVACRRWGDSKFTFKAIGMEPKTPSARSPARGRVRQVHLLPRAAPMTSPLRNRCLPFRARGNPTTPNGRRAEATGGAKGVPLLDSHLAGCCVSAACKGGSLPASCPRVTGSLRAFGEDRCGYGAAVDAIEGVLEVDLRENFILSQHQRALARKRGQGLQTRRYRYANLR